ncbi:MAG TPA: SurA N-terminal domain-containing protein [Rhodocyclaceae bacterium]|nr:SurA N-terminal domain-containing protein [Rhodocyclaceae bacterium]
MFEYVRNNPKLVQLFLALITLPFAFVGIQSFISNRGGGDEVASVGKSKITPQEWQRALREQEEKLRANLGNNFNPAMIKEPAVRRAVLESLINERVLALHAAESGLTTSDAELAQVIQSVPAFQDKGKFSRQRYDAYVAGQDLSPAAFEARLRQDINLQQLLGAVRDGSISGKVPADRWVAALEEGREVSEAALKPEQFAAQVKLGPDVAKTYYDAHRSAFETPEQLRAEYLVLSQDSLAAQVSVSDDDVKSWYQSHAASYRQSEERRVSHILIKLGKDAPAAEVKAAQAKAAEILAQVKKHPADFARLAKQYSQDPGSADKGGDLGWFSRGMMVKSFEDAAFGLKENEISGLVRSDFGFHIIELTGLKPERLKPLEEVRSDIVAELKRRAAQKKYDELAESFSNTVYEQADSLKPAADKFKLTIQQSPWLAKGGQAAAPFNNPKLLTALFSADAIKSKHNTEAVEVAPNTLVSARVLEYKPSALQPLAAVNKDIEAHLTREEAAKLARSAGEAALAKLVHGGSVDLAWSPARLVSRLTATGLSPDALAAVFRTDVAKLPAYTGVALPDGSYALYRISRVQPFVASKATEAQAKSLSQQYEKVIADQDFSAWLAALRLRYPVDIRKQALDAKEP